MNTLNQHTNKTANFVDIENARYDDQREEMQKIIDAGHCPFCMENFHLYHKQPTLKEGQYWLITSNQWPYDHTELHLLAILKYHAETISELKPEAGAELFQLFGEIEKEKNIPGGGIAFRFGDTNYSAGSVKHLHAQLIIPAINEPDFEPTRFKIGKSKK